MTEARQTSINAYRSFRSEGTQLERVMAALTECGPLCDAEISNVTGIPRHLVPARRGVLLDRGRSRRSEPVRTTLIGTIRVVDPWGVR